MRAWVRGAEALHGCLLVAGLLAPLAFFFFKVAPRGSGWAGAATDLFARPEVVRAIANSAALAAVTGVLSTALAFAASWLLWRFDWPARTARALTLLLKIPYLLPPFFFAIGWIALAAPGVGYLNQALLRLGAPALPSVYGLGGTIFVLVLWSTALAMIQLQTFFRQFPADLEDAAILCGASPARALARITLPLAKPHLLSCALLTAVSALAAFGVPAMLGAPARSYVLTTRIYQMIKGSAEFAEAGLLSLALLLVTLLALLLHRMAGRDGARALVGGKAARPAPLEPGPGARAAFAATWCFALVSCALPCAALLAQSLLRDHSDLGSWTLEKYAYVFGQVPDGWLALRNSLFTSILAAAAATLLGLLVSYGATRLRSRGSAFLEEAWSVGYSVPGTIIALALLACYSGSLSDTLWILALAYVVKYSAFATRTLIPALGAVSREMEEAAWMSGASPATAFARILVPCVRPALAAALFLALVPMLCELTMSVLLAGASTETLGSLIYRFQEYSDPGSAAVLAVVVAGAILMVNGLLRRFSRGGFGI